MPIDFLSPGQLTSYGRYGEPPSVAQLERFFHFDERDRALIARRRGDHNRLGFAVQARWNPLNPKYTAARRPSPHLAARLPWE